jgi:hypothetical protein
MKNKLLTINRNLNSLKMRKAVLLQLHILLLVVSGNVQGIPHDPFRFNSDIPGEIESRTPNAGDFFSTLITNGETARDLRFTEAASDWSRSAPLKAEPEASKPMIQEAFTSFDPYTGIQALDFSSQRGIQPSNLGKAVGYINDGDYIRFDQVAFGRGPLTGQIIASSNAEGGTIEFRTGSPSGTLIARAEISTTGGWRKFAPFDIMVTEPESYSDGTVFLGDQTLFLVFKGAASGYLFDVDSFTFEKTKTVSPSKSSAKEFVIFPNPAASGTVSVSIGALQPEEVDHVHIYTLDGEKIMSREVRQSVTQLDISGVLPGYYLMVIEGRYVGAQSLFRVK